MAAEAAQTASMQRRLKRMFKSDIRETPELRRVLELPRRVWDQEEIEGVGDVEVLTDLLSEYLRRPGTDVTLWKHQAKGLQELNDFGGLFADFPVGAGKTLFSLLAPVLLESKRPLLLVPAKLREKTEREFKELGKKWQTHPDYPVITFEKISRQNGWLLLSSRAPDLLVMDEVHKAKNPSAAVTKKLSRYMEENPKTKVLSMSGTIIDRSLLDFAHILEWTLPQGLYPLPWTALELHAWAAAVDRHKGGKLPGPTGALRLFCTREEVAKGRDGVRNGLRRRFEQTPGILSVEGPEVRASLNINLELVRGYNQKVHKLARRLLEGEKPDGDPVTDKDLSAQWRVMRTLTSGFWYDWGPRPPKEWLEARAAWKKFVRTALDYAHEHDLHGLESELLITRAVIGGDGRIPRYKKGQQLHAEWKEVESTYEGKRFPVWVDDRMIEYVANWTKHNRGIVWVNEVALGERLQEKLGLPYYHRMGLTKDKRFIDDADPKKGCIVASVESNKEGRNLQEKWHHSLVISPMPNGGAWEQMLGRTHRVGQPEDEVWFDVVFGCAVEWQCWQNALQDANFVTEINNKKKLTYATIASAFNPTLITPSALWPGA
jgi:hypothetical protein